MNREQSQEEFEGQLKEKQLQEGQITEDTEKSKQENKITEGVIWKQLLLFFFLFYLEPSFSSFTMRRMR